MDGLKKITKWPLVVIALLMIVVNYFALFELLEKSLISPLSDYLHSIGYYFSLQEPFLWVWRLVIPAASVFGYAIGIKNESLKDRIIGIYEAVTLLQLVALIILLPILLYLQNRIFGKIIDTKNKSE